MLSAFGAIGTFVWSLPLDPYKYLGVKITLKRSSITGRFFWRETKITLKRSLVIVSFSRATPDDIYCTSDIFFQAFLIINFFGGIFGGKIQRRHSSLR